MSDFNLSDPSAIAAISEALTKAGVDGIEIERGAQKLRIVVERTGAASVLVDAAKTAETNIVKAPLAGVFQPVPGTLTREVGPGEILGFIRVGPVLLPVKAPKAGVLAHILAEHGALVGYGHPLFETELLP
ncbi:acetyl-CoA carboxylase [Pararhizobium gei]|uniref:acetyl-CoA carboxylase n=1 Tax=Pararhizobium gei TaxID=1395951 RepID=UPI0023D9BA62|nr:acetyl-CoA carboxylase [Rhizobium gei]